MVHQRCLMTSHALRGIEAARSIATKLRRTHQAPARSSRPTRKNPENIMHVGPITPFKIRVPQAKLDRIMERVRSYEWFEAPNGDSDFGIPPHYMRDLVDYWANTYDWRKQERDLNRLPQYRVEIDGDPIHYIHEPGSGRNPAPLILLHGWPVTHQAFARMVEKLAHPERFGGDPEDGFDVVVPSMPGFGFSDRLIRPLGPRATADRLHLLMTKVLGYEHYVVHGGDWGGLVAEWMGVRHPQHVEGIHLNLAFYRHAGAAFGSGQTGTGQATAAELDWARSEQAAFEREFAYFQLQAGDPLTVSYAMMDSPVGQAAWILDKLLLWADHRGRDLKDLFSFDTVLTEVMIYLVTGTFYTAATIYRAIGEEGPITFGAGERIEVPVGFAAFPDPHCPPPPRELVEKSRHIVHWTDMPRGGHFPSLEEPDLLTQDLRQFHRALKMGSHINSTTP
ncbi:epoxide hydrolase family protein [Streptomyces sp. NPDC052309]|uniref:epoxide hydrolase family protein n=1 Tax=Streptomyces sp. NPDC052309 TaxID=3155421 RepID=UPI003434CBC1